MIPESGESQDTFREQYARGKSDVFRRVEQLAFGQDVGGNGYTTVGEARSLAKELELSADSLLLDLGAGRGWPGTYLARISGCRVVASDLPGEALQKARAYAELRGVSGVTSAVRADGAALPFSPRSFDAVAHADVLC